MLTGETIDYEVFQRPKCNRKIDTSVLKKLEKSIKEKNLLASKPIVVDRFFNVIDGQHRLEVAKKLGIPIPYQVDEKCDIYDMVKLNNNQKAWTINDYLNYYCHAEERPEYLKLRDFVERENLQLNIALHLLNGTKNKDFFERFKNGHYVFPNEMQFFRVIEKKSMISDTIDYLKKTSSGSKTYLSRVTFYGALVEFFSMRYFTYDIFRKKLQYKLEMLHPCSKKGDYINIFKNIYNWKNHSPL